MQVIARGLTSYGAAVFPISGVRWTVNSGLRLIHSSTRSKRVTGLSAIIDVQLGGWRRLHHRDARWRYIVNLKQSPTGRTCIFRVKQDAARRGPKDAIGGCNRKLPSRLNENNSGPAYGSLFTSSDSRKLYSASSSAIVLLRLRRRSTPAETRRSAAWPFIRGRDCTATIASQHAIFRLSQPGSLFFYTNDRRPV